MSAEDTTPNTKGVTAESGADRTDKRDGVPNRGPAYVLWKVDPSTPVDQIATAVDRWVCAECGNVRYQQASHCGDCGAAEFEFFAGDTTGDDA